MRFLADHNVEAPLVQRLREAGHDVLTVAELLEARAVDELVLSRASHDQRVLLTNDKDFGELAFFQRRVSAGIVLLRMPTLDSRQKADRLMHAMDRLGNSIAGAMVVVRERSIRRRPLPEL